MSCWDCEDKAKARGSKLDALRSGKYDEPMAIIETENGFEILPIMQAISMPIKEVLMPKSKFYEYKTKSH